MMLASDLSYMGNVVMLAASSGAFLAGKKRGRNEAQTDTISTLESLVNALKKKVDLLEQDKRDQALLIEKQQVWIEYLKGLVIGSGNSAVVPTGSLPELHGPGRPGGTEDPAGGGDG